MFQEKQNIQYIIIEREDMDFIHASALAQTLKINLRNCKIFLDSLIL